MNNARIRTLAIVAVAAVAAGWTWRAHAQAPDNGLDFQLPSAKVKTPFSQEQPIVFVTAQNLAEWQQLKAYWNPTTIESDDPATGKKVQRNGVKIKVPLGFSQAPRVPSENPLTVDRWKLGRDLYFDSVLSSDSTVSCATCHAPAKGFTDQSPVSTGIEGKKGGVSAPTVMNAAYSPLQFWDGRAATLEDQAQGPPQNPVEMFDGKGNAWHEAVKRIRARGDYRDRFLKAFGHEPTRDGVAMAIANYERTVLNGNSIHDRAELNMKFRVSEEGLTTFKFAPADYEKAIKDAFKANDKAALAALQINDESKAAELAKKINEGRELFFNKARCTLCHTGENYSDGQFHNLGVGVKDGKLAEAGRYGALPTGAKNPEAMGAFKTPTVRGILSTGPYMHDGSEKTLEEVVDFYDKGGNANEYLDPKMRDTEAERVYRLTGKAPAGVEVKTFGPDQTPIIPFQLRLTPPEKQALVLFMRSLQGEVDPIVLDPKTPVPTASR